MNIDAIKDFKKIKEYSEQALYSEDWQGANNLIYFLEQNIKKLDLRKSNNLLFQEYEKMILKLKWVCLDIYSEEEIIELIKNNFIDIYKINDDYDIWLHVRIKLLQQLDFDKRNDFKLRIRRTLKDNNQTLTAGGKIKSVSDWINEYARNVGESMVSKLKQLEFFQKNHNFQMIDENDKQKIKKLLSFYERLKISSKSLLGVEEGVPVPEEESPYTHIRDGQIIAPEKNDKLSVLIDQVLKQRSSIDTSYGKERDARQLQQPASQSPIDSLEQKAIKEEKEKEDQIDELVKLVNQYPEGSLERKAVRDEINKLKI
ncbi:hypothetical protein KKH38_01780 [Patescibacteria group bacterium]|nr:hypothetical protein [Patescibacteria group bacterium]MBU4601317.1 hypothetical protein [Patescibacteria group bacterium]MCG2698626.1 hypothetical protein [Candidatus Parcubacteria bacterium]